MANIDKIVVTQDGAAKTFTPDSWKALPLPERVGMIKVAKFFAGSTEIAPRDAIAQLR